MTEPLVELWTIDCAAMFKNYANFRAVPYEKETGAIGGIVYGRKSKRQVVHVFFAHAEDLTENNSQLIESSLTSDIEPLGNVVVEGKAAPLIAKGFTLNCTLAILEGANTSEFLELNAMFNNGPVLLEGLSLAATTAWEWYLRPGREVEDLKVNSDRHAQCAYRFTFINEEKDVVIRQHPEKEKTLKQLDQFSKGAIPYKDVLDLKTLQSLTRDTSNDTEDQKMVPTLKVNRDGKQYTRAMTVANLVSVVHYGEDSQTIHQRMSLAFKRCVKNTALVTTNGLKKGRGPAPTTSAVFLPPNWSSFLHLQLPTKWTDNEQKTYRRRLHRLFNLPPSQPCLRLSQALPFCGAASLVNKKLLRSPHSNITNYKQVGTVSLVKGAYSYHHYMQDGIDDNGWGCAYRSFQTIWSWFILNGYTDKPVPSHRQIQQCLVDIGDKDDNFVGSRKWIGSTEISFVLNTLLGVESRFIATNSGAEVVERVRELAYHFDTVGSPVMIGGNMLAHTILGVDFNDSTGEAKFLILDPHYTGAEDVKTIISRGWCNWKPSSFWSPAHFYNMVLPQPLADAL